MKFCRWIDYKSFKNTMKVYIRNVMINVNVQILYTKAIETVIVDR